MFAPLIVNCAFTVLSCFENLHFTTQKPKRPTKRNALLFSARRDVSKLTRPGNQPLASSLSRMLRSFAAERLEKLLKYMSSVQWKLTSLANVHLLQELEKVRFNVTEDSIDTRSSAFET